MLNRRSFLTQTALAAAALPLASSFDWLGPAPRHIGVQLWSVREDMFKDPKATLAAVAKSGYREVEPFGYDSGKLFGMSLTDFHKALKDNGLSMPSTHCMITSKSYNAAANDINDDLKKVIDQAAGLGLKYVIVPYMADEDRKQIGTMIKTYTAAAKYAKKAGVRLGYHNHDFEYKVKGDDNRLIIEWLLHEIDPSLLAMEMDIYWVYYANHNPLDWFRLYPGRWELCHAKDLSRSGTEKVSIEVGDGEIDFKDIFKHSAQAGLKHYVIELEHYKTTPLAGIDRARKGLLKTF